MPFVARLVASLILISEDEILGIESPKLLGALLQLLGMLVELILQALDF